MRDESAVLCHFDPVRLPLALREVAQGRLREKSLAVGWFGNDCEIVEDLELGSSDLFK